MSHSYNSIEEVLKAVKSNQLSINDAKDQLSKEKQKNKSLKSSLV